MNKRKGELHRWIIDEVTKIGFPWVRHLGGTNKIAYMRLWEHKCGKQLIIYDIGRSSKV
jgi:hypothetical protein